MKTIGLLHGMSDVATADYRHIFTTSLGTSALGLAYRQLHLPTAAGRPS